MARNFLILASMALASTATAQETPPAPPTEPATVPLAVPPGADARDIATQVCTAEAEKRKVELGATAVTMREVKDTDLKRGDIATVNAEVNVIKTDSKGNSKSSKKKMECTTRNGVVTAFKWK